MLITPLRSLFIGVVCLGTCNVSVVLYGFAAYLQPRAICILSVKFILCITNLRSLLIGVLYLCTCNVCVALCVLVTYLVRFFHVLHILPVRSLFYLVFVRLQRACFSVFSSYILSAFSCLQSVRLFYCMNFTPPRSL